MPLISEIQPNPNNPGSDPSMVTVEFTGTPNTSYVGYLSSIEGDNASGSIDYTTPINITFDANGIATTQIDDLENPAFTLVLSSDEPTDLTDFGTVEDAVGVSDGTGDTLYGNTFGGTNLPSIPGGEASLIFRDAGTGNWFLVNQAGTKIYDQNGSDVSSSFTDAADYVPTFGTTNPCFLADTKILTEIGYKNIETLKIGDLIKTFDGKKLPIKWIGINTAKVGSPAFKGNPICFKKGSLGENIPSSDLFVSPDHAMFVDNLLINAGALVNDVTIYKTNPKEDFIYYHIELESHEIIIAEDAPTESYLAQNDKREHFDNAEEFEKLYPNGSNLMLWPMDIARIASTANVPNYVLERLNNLAGIKLDAIEEF